LGIDLDDLICGEFKGTGRTNGANTVVIEQDGGIWDGRLTSAIDQGRIADQGMWHRGPPRFEMDDVERFEINSI